jgi:hypothetical protein
MAKRLLLLSGALLIAAMSGGWNVHGVGVAPEPAPPSYPDWRVALTGIPCDKIVKDGKDLKVIGPVTSRGPELARDINF